MSVGTRVRTCARVQGKRESFFFRITLSPYDLFTFSTRRFSKFQSCGTMFCVLNVQVIWRYKGHLIRAIIEDRIFSLMLGSARCDLIRR